MTTLSLADALRAMLAAPAPCDCGPQGCGAAVCRDDRREDAVMAARAALSAHDADTAERAARSNVAKPGRAEANARAARWSGLRVGGGASVGPDGVTGRYVRDAAGLAVYIDGGPLEDAMARGARIVACVNACAGIADPAAFVAAVRALDSATYAGEILTAADAVSIALRPANASA